jgi:hypothetical protein
MLWMPVEYYAENHDWDMTLRAARYLAVIGQAKKLKPEHPFSCFTGSMLLRFVPLRALSIRLHSAWQRIRGSRHLIMKSLSVLEDFGQG